jgi:hypothetical protein
MGMKITQTIVESQIKYGILDILKEAQPYFSRSYVSVRVHVFFDDESSPKAINLTGWKNDTPMLTGLTEWYKKNSAAVGDKVIIEVLGNNSYRLSIRKWRGIVSPIERQEKASRSEEHELFDYRDAAAVLEEKGLLSEVNRILSEIDKADHTKIQELFRRNGWETGKRILPQTTWAWDAYKDRVVMSLEFSLVDAVHRDFFRLLMWHQDKKVDAVLYITTTFREPKFENVRRDLEILRSKYSSLLPVLIYLVGLKH